MRITIDIPDEELAAILKRVAGSNGLESVVPKPDVLLVESLDIPTRAYNCLTRDWSGPPVATTVDDVAKLTFMDLLRIKNMGPLSACEVQVALEKHGLGLKGGVPRDARFQDMLARVRRDAERRGGKPA